MQSFQPPTNVQPVAQQNHTNAVNNNNTNAGNTQNGFNFINPQPQGQPQQTRQPQQNLQPMQPQQNWVQEHYTYQYPTRGEIWGDLALRVFEVVIGAAAIAAGNEIAKFFSRRRFESPIRRNYEYPQNYHNNQNNNPNNWWQK